MKFDYAKSGLSNIRAIAWRDWLLLSIASLGAAASIFALIDVAISLTVTNRIAAAAINLHVTGESVISLLNSTARRTSIVAAVAGSALTLSVLQLFSIYRKAWASRPK